MVKFGIIELLKSPKNPRIARRAFLLMFPWLIALCCAFTLTGDSALAGLVVALLCAPLSFVV